MDCRLIERGPVVLQEHDDLGANRVDRRFMLPLGALLVGPVPGDVWAREWHEPGAPWCWANCTGVHTLVLLPNGRSFDCDYRASNCGSPDDRVHRCWVKHGSAATRDLHLSKEGLTCVAGAGSILSHGHGDVSDWHGFLCNFKLVENYEPRKT